MFPNAQSPAEHTKELFGVEYLYAQSGMNLSPTIEDFDDDEGFEELEDEPIMPITSHDDTLTISHVSQSDSEEEEEARLMH